MSVDRLTPEHRSWNMSRIGSSHTRPEIRVRSLLHRAGFRFSLRRKELPGNPDIVLPRHGTVIFVHGCFWHRHGRENSTMPKTRAAFWSAKFSGNVERDRRNARDLRRLGWRVVTVWECELDDENYVLKGLERSLRARVS
ncbi:MAG: DNA mismatch endonuclease Vsr [Acidobacteriota bacterium]|nr:DNA mismatch endonuclease Vsr [Acidobacteriota bacterium]